MLKVIVVVLLLAMPMNGNAQIYRCTSETGTIIFSEVPCADDAEVVPAHRLNVNIHDRIVSTPSTSAPSRPVPAQDCYQSSIVSPSPFMGNNGEIFKLNDGTLWEVKYEYEYLYAYTPAVIICPSKGKLAIKGKALNVERIGATPSARPKSQAQKLNNSEIIESQIDGDFEGWEGETIVKLTNGQIWQQIEYYYYYRYAFMPKVHIFRTGGGYKMVVDGVKKPVGVELLN